MHTLRKTSEVPLFIYTHLSLLKDFNGIFAAEEGSKFPFPLTYLLLPLPFIVHERMLFALAGLMKIYTLYSFPFPS